jgi:hypothetical protein
MMDYSFCFGIDLIITMLIIFMLALGIYVFRNGPIMSGIIAMLTGMIVIYMAMTTFYEDVLQQDAVAYRYKIAIEENLDNGFSQHFYEEDDDGRAAIINSIENADLIRGKLGVQYGYGAKDTERHYIRLYLDTLFRLYFLPLVLPIIVLPMLIAGGYRLVTISIRSYDAVKKEKESLEKELSQIKVKVNQGWEDYSKVSREIQKKEEINRGMTNVQEQLDEKEMEFSRLKFEMENYKNTPKYVDYMHYLKDEREITQKLESLNKAYQTKKEEAQKLKEELDTIKENKRILDSRKRQKKEQINKQLDDFLKEKL